MRPNKTDAVSPKAVSELVEVFSGPNCGYCDRAKALLDRKGVAFTDLDISQPENREAFMRRLPRSKAVPQIFIGGEHVGGCEDLEILNDDGTLDKLLGR